MDSLCYCYFSSFPCLPELLSITSMYFICYVLMDFIRLKQAFVCFHQNWFFFLHSHIILAKNRTALELMYSSLHGYPVLMALALLAQQWNKAWQSASAFTFFLFLPFFCFLPFFFFQILLLPFCFTYWVCFVSLIPTRRNTVLLALFKGALIPLF